MTNTLISDTTILHFCRFYMIDIPVNCTFFQNNSMSDTQELIHDVVDKINPFNN